jgi:vacuole morphology and inheritance protein 14
MSTLERSSSILSVVETHKIQSSQNEKHEIEKDIPKGIIQNLLEKNYEKRKQGGHLLQKYLKEQLAAKKSLDLISKSIRYFHEVFLLSVDESYRQAGLMAFSAIASSTSCHEDYIESLVNPVISCCRDNSSKIKYYAVECLYNIVKICRKDVLFMFNHFFKAIVDLCIGLDKEVKKASKKLDSLLKTIVVECEANEEIFSSEQFMKLLKEMSTGSSIAYVQRMIVSWLTVLDSIPDFNLFTFIPCFFEGVLLMLRNPDQKLHRETTAFLIDLRNEIKSDFDNSNLNVSFIMQTVAKVIEKSDKSIKTECMTWISELVDRAEKKMIKHFPMGLKAVFECLSDENANINQMAAETNKKICEVFKRHENDLDIEEDIKHIVQVLIKFIEHDSSKTRHAALEWLIVMQQKHQQSFEVSLEDMIIALSTRLSDSDGKIIANTLIILCNIAKYREDFDKVISSVLKEFSRSKTFSNEAVKSKIKILCENLGTLRVYKSFADLLNIEMDLVFCKKVIEVLNDLLLIDDQFEEIRERLKYCFESGDKEIIQFFESLYKAWCFNPGCALILTFLVQCYDLAYELVNIL